MLGRTRERFGPLLEELEGMADGMALPFEQLFAHVCRSEIGVLARTPGCSTLGWVEGGHVVFAHNEDGDDRNAGHMFEAQVRPPSGVAFRAFCYPALPPCNGPGRNDLGLVHTTNYIQPARTHDIALGVSNTGPYRSVGSSCAVTGRVPHEVWTWRLDQVSWRVAVRAGAEISEGNSRFARSVHAYGRSEWRGFCTCNGCHCVGYSSVGGGPCRSVGADFGFAGLTAGCCPSSGSADS